MLVLANAGFELMDWVVLGAYFLLLVGTGIYFSLKQRRRTKGGTEDYFLGGHRMPVWAVAFSILATAQSAATFVGVPESAYTGDLTYLSSNIGGILAAILLARIFIPAYYKLGVVTPYQLLETRFGPGARVVASFSYMVGRVFAGGARLFIGALPFSMIVFGDISLPNILISLVVFTIFGILYTLWGGISSVIWTDVIQVSVYFGAAISAIIVLLYLIPVSPGEILSALHHPPNDAPSKLTVVKTGIDLNEPYLGFNPATSYTLFTAVFGFSLLTLASHGADQDLVQRMLTCKSARKGSWSVISGVLIGVPVVLVFLIQGLLLYIFYQRPDVMGAAAPTYATPASNELAMTFSMREMPAGLAGFMLAGLLAAGPCGINSSLNAMSSTFVSDFYRNFRPGRSDRHYVHIGRLGVVVAGIIVGGFAVISGIWYDPKDKTLLDFALGVMSFAYAGLLAVFLSALFTRRGSTRSCIAAIITGFLVVLSMQSFVLKAVARLVDPSLDSINVLALANLAIAFPWQLFIGTAIAFGVCQLGRRRVPPPDGRLGDSAEAASL